MLRMDKVKAEPETCPTCKQPMPQEARTPNPRGGVPMQCEFCDRRASFVIHKRVVCYEHRAKAKG
jgi:hypothetical protein